MEPVKTTVRRYFYHVLSNYITIALGSRLPRSRLRRLSDLCLLAHIYCCYSTDCQLTRVCLLRAQPLIYGDLARMQLTAGPHAVNQSAVSKNTGPRYRASYRTTGPHAILCQVPRSQLQVQVPITPDQVQPKSWSTDSKW